MKKLTNVSRFWLLLISIIIIFLVLLGISHKNAEKIENSNAIEISYTDSIEEFTKESLEEYFNEPSEDSKEDASREEGTDLWWLAHLIRGEADTQNTEDMQGVAVVIMNRLENDSYPNTIPEVIKDKEHGIQYDCYWNKNSQFYKEPTEECWEIASQALEGERWGWPPNIIYQAEFEQCKIYKIVETRFSTHYFCYE